MPATKESHRTEFARPDNVRMIMPLGSNPGDGELCEIPLTLLDESVSNHRRTLDEKKTAELAASIEQDGLMQPIRVYHNGEEQKKRVRYILGFGFRRVAAHRMLKRATVRAFVMPPASEEDIRAMQAVENLQRQDLAPLEEATACEALVTSLAHHYPDADHNTLVAQAAAKIGMSRPWVESRLTLLRLSPRVRQLLDEEKILLGHAKLIARLASYDDQEEVAGMVQASPTPKYYGSGHVKKGDMEPPESIADTRRLVEGKLRTLKDVPWNVNVEFGGKVACAACPENAANAPGLFDGDAPPKATCLNAKCYAHKFEIASRGVIRARNTLVKMEVSATPAQAKKAMREREVEFLSPAAVVKAAKRAKQPKKKTKPEQRGVSQAAAKQSLDIRYQNALREWRDRIQERAIRLVASSGWSVAYMILVAHMKSATIAHPDRGTKKGNPQDAWKTYKPLLLGIGALDPREREELVRTIFTDLLGEFIRDEGQFRHYDNGLNNTEWFVRDLIEEVRVLEDMPEIWLEVYPDLCDVEEIGPMPQRADFEEAPEPEAPSTGKKKSKSNKKKAATRRANKSRTGAAAASV